MIFREKELFLLINKGQYFNFNKNKMFDDDQIILMLSNKMIKQSS